MKGRDFLRIAKRMERLSRVLPQREKEALLRRAVSTIYYGVLWEITDFLQSKGVQISKSYKIHQTVRMSLQVKGFTQASDRLKSLHAIRKIADYDRDFRITHKDFKIAELYAKLILTEVGL